MTRPTRPGAAALSLSLLLATGCATVFQAGKPVDIERAPLSTVYKQAGQPVRYPSLLDGLEAVDASREEAQAARKWALGSAVAGAAGGFGIGYGVALAIDGDSAGWGWLGGGLAVGAVGYWLGTYADAHTEAAVKQYNGQLAAPPKVTVVPYLAPAPPAPGQRAPSGVSGGLVMRF